MDLIQFLTEFESFSENLAASKMLPLNNNRSRAKQQLHTSEVSECEETERLRTQIYIINLYVLLN